MTLFGLVGACTFGLVATVISAPPCRWGTPPPRPVIDFRRLDPFIPLSWSVLNRTDNRLHQYADLKFDDSVVRVFVGKRGELKSEEELVRLVRKKLIDGGYRECEEGPHGFVLGSIPEPVHACLGVAGTREPVVVVVA